MISSVITLVIGGLSLAYFIIVQIVSPGTFLGTIFSFSAVWLIIAVVCGLLFILRKKHLWRKIPKFLKIVFYCCCAIIAGIFIFHLYQINSPVLSDGTEKSAYVILLGGGVTKDAELTDAVKQRVKMAADYMKKHPEAVAVVTGGKGPFSPCPESDVLKPALASYGIEENRILAENMAKDTIDNFDFSAKLIAKTKNIPLEEVLNAPVTIITNDFHMARAQKLALRMGFTKIYGVQAETPVVFKLNCYAREICCWIKLNLRILFTGKPEKIK